MKYWGVQKRILLITLMPCLMTALALGSYFTFSRMQDLKAQSVQVAQTLTRQAAMSADHWLGLDHSQLHQSMQMYLDLKEVQSIALLNPQQISLFQLGPRLEDPASDQLEMIQDLHQIASADSLRVRAPIYANGNTSQLLGWVEMAFDNSRVHIQQYQAIVTALLLILASTVVGLYLSLRASQRISQPLQGIAITLEQLEAGNLDARVRMDTENDFSMLAAGINAMATSLQHAQQELQESVEQATHDLKETLETLEVQNIELNMARKEALDASQTKSEFLANMSHEIRTPLNGILGFAKLLEKTKLNRRQMEYLHTIESSSSSLLTIINDILDFSKIEAGKLVLDKVPMQLRDVMDEVTTMLAPEAHKKNLELATLIYHDVPHEMVGDPSRIKQILTNLVSNAVKFTEQGSVVIRVMLEEEQEQKVTLRFSVTDTGIGLSDTQKDNLFKAFSQADASTSRRFGGTGLGLVISKYLVDHMHGDIGVESKAGAGSTFWFTAQLEAADTHAEHHEDHQEEYPWQQAPAYLLCQRTATRQALQHQLMDLGFDAQVFTDMESLLQACEQKTPEVALVEITDIQHHPKLWKKLANQTEVIALLPSNDAVLLDYCQQQSIDRHVVFPVAQRRLSHLIHDMLHVESNQHIGQNSTRSDKPTKSVRVLAVDDNEPNLQLLTTWLGDLGVVYMRARGGKQAVSMASNHHFDLIFMDIQMPDMDGVTAGKLICQGGPNMKTPLIALTAHALPNERKQLLQEGFDDYLTKPISEEQLAHTLRKWTHYQGANITSIEDAEIVETPTADTALDLNECLSLAGGKASLAQDMLRGLLAEMERVKPLIHAQEPDQLIEPVHKLHGVCRYVGVPKLRAAVEAAETCLKTDCAQWFIYRPALLQAISDLEEQISQQDWLNDLEALAS